MQMFLTWSRLARDWGELESSYIYLVVLKKILETVLFPFVRNYYWKFF